MISFWRWFFLGYENNRSGWKKFFDLWILLHIIVAILLAWLVKSSLQDVARNFLLPLSSILIGLTFAWGGNAQVILQTEEIETFASYHPGGLQEYVYTYQAAILMIITTIIFWGIAALGIVDSLLPNPLPQSTILPSNASLLDSIRHFIIVPVPLLKTPLWYALAETTCYFLSSLALRECWLLHRTLL